MKLQRVQNTAAKLVLKRSKYDSTSQAMKQLHWLPIECHIVMACFHLLHSEYVGAIQK